MFHQEEQQGLFRSLGSDQMQNSDEGFSSQNMNHIESSSGGRRWDYLDHQLEEISQMGNSRDTLQSLVQSSFCSTSPRRRNHHHHHHHHQIISNNYNVPPHDDDHHQKKKNQNNIIECRDWRQFNYYSTSISFQKCLLQQPVQQFQVENHEELTKKLINSTQISCSKMEKRKRMRWTQELHNQFLESVRLLGGPKKATPKGILKLMKCEGLTIFHIKSHLQKYRVTQYVPESKQEDNTENTQRSSITELDQEMSMQIVEALKMQIDVQKRLYEQLQCQKNLQSRIEEQAQQLKKMFDCRVETNTENAS